MKYILIEMYKNISLEVYKNISVEMYKININIYILKIYIKWIKYTCSLECIK